MAVFVFAEVQMLLRQLEAAHLTAERAAPLRAVVGLFEPLLIEVAYGNLTVTEQLAWYDPTVTGLDT